MNAQELIEFLELSPDADVSIVFIKSDINEDGSFSENIRIAPVTSIRYNATWKAFEIAGAEEDASNHGDFLK